MDSLATNFSQTLNEIYNILSLYVPVSPMMRTRFISHFVMQSMSNDYNYPPFELRMMSGHIIATIEVFEFQPPNIKPNPEFVFDFEPVKAAFVKYFENEARVRGIIAKKQAEDFAKSQTVDTNSLYQSMNSHKPIRQISLKDTQYCPPELTINYDDIRQSPNIPNIGRASL